MTPCGAFSFPGKYRHAAFSFQCAQRLIYIVVSYGYFHGKTISSRVRFPGLLRGKLIVKKIVKTGVSTGLHAQIYSISST